MERVRGIRGNAQRGSGVCPNLTVRGSVFCVNSASFLTLFLGMFERFPRRLFGKAVGMRALVAFEYAQMTCSIQTCPPPPRENEKSKAVS